MATTRVQVTLDDSLLSEAMAQTGLKSESAVIDEALRCLLRSKCYQALRELRGKVQWEGDLDEMRRNRFPEWSS